MSGLKRLKAAKPVLSMQIGDDTHPHPQIKKNMQCAQAVILEIVG
jgi:hypothetical protein